MMPMKATLRVFLLAVIVSVASACGNKGPLVQADSPAGAQWRDTEARRKLAKLNRERAEHGLAPLSALPETDDAAARPASGASELAPATDGDDG